MLSPRLPSRVGGRVECQVGLEVSCPRSLVQVWRVEPFTSHTTLHPHTTGAWAAAAPFHGLDRRELPPAQRPAQAQSQLEGAGRGRGGGGSRARSVLSTSPALTGLLAAAAVSSWGTEEEEGVELLCGWTRSSPPTAAGAGQLSLSLLGPLRACT